MPVFHLIAGPNGAGKSTLYRYLIQPRYPLLPFINADLHERAQLGHIQHPVKRSDAARAWADAQRDTHLRERRSFVSETVFSHPSKVQLVAEAVGHGFDVVLYVVCLDEPRRLLERVHRRVEEGGHGVPVAKILERYPRTLDNLSLAVKKVQLALLFDAADTDTGGPHLVASVVDGQVQAHGPWLPMWAQRVLDPARSA